MHPLILMRHAKAEPLALIPRDSANSTPESSSEVYEDRDRPLSPRGRKDAARMGAWLSGQTLLPDPAACWVSPAQRTQETYAVAFGASAASPADQKTAQPRACTLEPRLYLASSAQLDWLIEEALAQFDQALLLGHNNGMEDWVLTAAPKALSGFPTAFPTAAVAIFRREGSGAAWRLKASATYNSLAAD